MTGSTDTYFVVAPPSDPDGATIVSASKTNEANSGAVREASPNKELGLTRSHHISASFAQRLGDNAMLKVEPYWQWLFDVPVEQGTTYSIINHNMFFQDRVLTNDGAAR